MAVNRQAKLELSTSYESDDIAYLDSLPGALDRAMLQGTLDAADELERAIRARIPRSGEQHPHAQDSFKRRVIPYSNGAVVIVYSESEVAYFYWSGTRAHPIVARVAKALHFYRHGEEWFRKSVRHPGTRPHPYMEEAGRVIAANAPQRYEDAVSRAVRR